MKNTNDGRRDFDFFMGTWEVHHKRLQQRLQACTEWDEFTGEGTAPILGGLGNVDEVSLDGASGAHFGATLRLFTPASREWGLYWTNSASGTLFKPLVGRFEHGRGVFYGHEVEGGRHVYSRFVWSEIAPTPARWEQALSANGAQTWETNWVMQFGRKGVS